MASLNERARWEKWFNEVTSRMGRQRQAIHRLVNVNTEALAALHEIKSDDILSLDEARERARLALERIERPSAAITEDARELTEGGDPDDPRNRRA